jgi:outer membrane protein OmpA-like peptidoglycan-associated protein
LKDAAAAVLRQIKTTILDQHPGSKIVIEGHTDDLGTLAYNIALSERRAKSVAECLEQQGVDPARVEIKGIGKSRPKYPNDTEENRARNRRVEISLVTEPPPAQKK